MNNKKKELSEREMILMKYMWSAKKPVMVSDLLTFFEQEYGKKYAATTMNTMLRRLMAAGYVERGEQYIAFSGYPYSYKISEEEYIGQQMNQYRKKHFDGSTGDFIVSLLRTQEISSEERGRIQECMDELKEKDGR
ncbi:MAG: BlaI/MecI/CopY family transcriptional regulator [Lachnospiraceae bacterium]|nr:BlaI/MecI/CopY family transcriptional regulator [Lachnospiraceae bacterium]